MVAYTVVLNSLKGTGALISSKTYLFNWSVFESRKYSVSFSYVSKVDNFNGAKIPLLHVQLGGSRVYTTGTSIAAQSFAQLGALLIAPHSDHSLFATSNTNPPVYLDTRPYSQQFTVEVQDETGALYTDTAGNDILDYVLTLCFTSID